MKKSMDVRKLVFLALMVAQSLVLYVIESLMPLPFVAPGAKLGLSNIVSLTALLTFGLRDAFVIMFLRVMISSLFWGGMSIFLYSIAGGVLSIIAMWIVIKIFGNKIGTTGISITGAVAHNIGQLSIAAMVIENIKIFYYLPVLMGIAVPTGIFVGVCTGFMKKYVKKLI
ncbi:heptaprenyl diphosphate synthase [Peptoclostridium litorale DSM 5388]|uniref:Heptaprenyl diphosphate synthase component I n=1 Tax=Peptoclostridium litorale DSM 5388 TaxID=1121324 RepID=A0A069RC52_PEPLI|nr:Gx transporter family protein [Peptoclostridium litorale]KDR93845.1 heptaprenyl diphosphate synthase component I [Peptoclostridium litorale DSM 5388]SIN87004.1 heptaprenyl diphosphate synthase [Peptoclostridium litorale DSM 5388]